MARNSEKIITIRKILVAVDTSTHSGMALEAATTIAKIMEANIHGLFVQEEHWSHIGRLPKAKTINELTGKTRFIEEDAIEKQVELLAKHLHRKLRMISQRYEVDHSWKSVRGRVIDEILKAAEEADLITIGRRGSSLLQRKKLGSTAKAIIRQANKPVLVLADGLHLHKSITIIYDGSEASQNGLWLALSIAQKNRNGLSILLVGNKDVNKSSRKKIKQITDKTHVPVSVSKLGQPGLGKVIHFINRQRPGLLVIPKEQPLIRGDALEITLDHIKCPALIV